MGLEAPYQFDAARFDEQHAALELALRPLAPQSRAPLLDSLSIDHGHPLGPLAALCVARGTTGALLAACWAQPCPGRSAVFWAPEWVDPARQSTEVERCLIRHALNITDASGIDLVQALFDRTDAASIPALLSVGFHQIARLAYLRRTVPKNPAAPRSTLRFEPCTSDYPPRLKQLLKASYEQSLDCPGLEGLRSLDDTIEGYRATGRHNPENWFFVHEGGEQIGVLLTAEHPDSQQLELVYMGVSPSARGRGIGREMIAKTLQVAAERRARQVVVAVDVANPPAHQAYLATGFRAWADRWVFVRGRRRT